MLTVILLPLSLAPAQGPAQGHEQTSTSVIGGSQCPKGRYPAILTDDSKAARTGLQESEHPTQRAPAAQRCDTEARGQAGVEPYLPLGNLPWYGTSTNSQCQLPTGKLRQDQLQAGPAAHLHPSPSRPMQASVSVLEPLFRPAPASPQESSRMKINSMGKTAALAGSGRVMRTLNHADGTTAARNLHLWTLLPPLDRSQPSKASAAQGSWQSGPH